MLSIARFLCIVCTKMKENKYVTHQETPNTELQAPDLGQAYIYIYGMLRGKTG